MSAAIPDGIYFNMPEEVYLAEERLSKSSIKRLRVSPADYWADSAMNPKRKERDTDAHVAGRAYHCARLEPERFEAVYVRELSKAEMPEGMLFTGTEMKEWLKAHELKQTGTVAEQAERIADADPSQPLWQIALAEWQAAIKPGQIAISAELYDEIVEDMQRMHSVPAIHSLLSGGAAEVSVFWTCQDTGIPMKARFDYLKADRWVELKSFANPKRKNLYRCIVDAISYERYYIDAAGYMEAAEAIRSGTIGIEGGIGSWTDEQEALINAIRERSEPLDCHFVFQQKSGVPNILDRKWRFFEPTPSDEAIRELERDGADEAHLARARHFQEVAKSQRQRTAIYTKGRMEIAAAKRDFLAYSEIYERGEPWLPFNPSGEITDEDFSQFWLDDLPI